MPLEIVLKFYVIKLYVHETWMIETRTSTFYFPMEEHVWWNAWITRSSDTRESNTGSIQSVAHPKKLIVNALRVYERVSITQSRLDMQHTCRILWAWTDGSLIAERIVLASLDTRKAETIRDCDWFCQCNSQLFLANGFLLVFSELEQCIWKALSARNYST